MGAEIVLAGQDVALTALSTLEQSGALTSVGLTLPTTITEDEYQALGRALGQAHGSIAWAVGDYLVAGESMFGESWAELSEALGLSEDSRGVYMRVSQAIPRPKRRPELSFSHHRAVCSMSDEYERDSLLDKAIKQRWTVRELIEHKKNQPVGELPKPSLHWRLGRLRDAVSVIVGAAVEIDQDVLGGNFDGPHHAVPTPLLEQLQTAIEETA